MNDGPTVWAATAAMYSKKYEMQSFVHHSSVDDVLLNYDFRAERNYWPAHAALITWLLC